MEDQKLQQTRYCSFFWKNLELSKHLRSKNTPEDYNEAMYKHLDGNGFNISLYLVASLGFLASSYLLFASSIIGPALDFVYPNDSPPGLSADEVFDLVTLAGIILGMILFGHLADRMGRKRLYGLELIILIFSTIGIVFSSDGYMVPTCLLQSPNDPSCLAQDPTSSNYLYTSTMNVFRSITTWRFFLGVGIGAEYPMSAIIAAEYTGTQWRGTVMAAVFFMQSVGRVLALGLADGFVQHQVSPNGSQYEQGLAVDKTWRFVVGFGGVFAVIAVALRLTIPESPRYYDGIDGAVRRTMLETGTTDSTNARSAAPALMQTTPWILAAIKHLAENYTGRKLAFIAFVWFLLDVCFYGTGLDSPSTLNLLWLTSPPSNSSKPWEEDPGNPTESIYSLLYNNGARSIEVSSISSLVGSFIVIILINRVSRAKLILWTSLVLAVIFFITGALVISEFAKPSSVASLVFFALSQFMFNLGPNTVIFILAAEIFPTPFRGTFYGLAAASGKAGALFIRPFVQIAAHKQNPGPMLCVYGGLMVIIAVLTYLASDLLKVQDMKKHSPFQRLENMALEEIAPFTYKDADANSVVPIGNDISSGTTGGDLEQGPDNLMQDLDWRTGRAVERSTQV